MARTKGSRFEKYNTKKILGMAALVVLLSLSDGRGGARTIAALVKAASKKYRQKEYADEYYRTMLYRLKRDGLVASSSRGIWMLTPKGRDMARMGIMPRTPKPAARLEDADVAVIFDIPEADRKKRAALRYELFMRGFFVFQKSVWLGVGPLDAQFIELLRALRLLKYVHIFNIAKRGTI